MKMKTMHMHRESGAVEITARQPLFSDLTEAWQYRWMAVALARRNIKTRYTQTILGPGWFILQPILFTGVLTLVMGAILKVSSDGVPYVLFAGSGTVLWTTFNRGLIETSTSLVATGGIFSKVYFPRILVPVAALMTAAADFAPVYALLIILILAFGLFSGWLILAFPLFVLVTVILTFGLGLGLTVLDSYFRDIRLIVPFALQFVFYFSPIIYAPSVVPERWQIFFKLNPITGLLNFARFERVIVDRI
jgi:lipopolysaccharide transport system permease protein